MKDLSILAVVAVAAQSVLGGFLMIPTVKTTSGTLRGSENHGVLSFKGIPYGQAPIQSLRWEPPKPYISSAIRNATALGPSCIQQVPDTVPSVTDIFGFPSVPESEDCLFLNVWAPSDLNHKKPVVFWLYGGNFALGTASIPLYDGESIALHQDIVVVTINYRTNVFGFPVAEELFPAKENLGLMDQDLALQWVQQNIGAFGGDPRKVTIMGASAGSISVAHALQRHSLDPPFRAAIMQSGAAGPLPPVPSFTPFDALSKAVNCTQPPGAERLACMRTIPADAIRSWADGPQGFFGAFMPIADNATVFTNPIERIQQKKTARVPIISGSMQDDGTFFTIGVPSLQGLLNIILPSQTPDQIRALYPGLTDTQIIPLVFRDLLFVCPSASTTGAYVQTGMKDAYRYMYGAVFQDLQNFPNAGAWHGSEIGEIFGTYNKTTATAAEVTLSKTMQTIWANFIKDPTNPPAIHWPRYVPGNATQTLVKLAYNGNVELSNVVQPSSTGPFDGPCDRL